MSLKLRLIDWLSGGYYSEGLAAILQRNDLRRRMATIAGDLSRDGIRYDHSTGTYTHERLAFAEAQAHEAAEEARVLQTRLTEIAACETDKANATVRRMARIARGEK